jgi:undecaprenyl pyrophosphate phosphatase UppP
MMGFIGLTLLSPLVQSIFNLNTGLCGLTASIMLSLMSLPIILGGGLVEVFDLGGANITPGDLASYAVGALVAAVSGWLAIQLVFGAVRRGRFSWYALYCAVVGSIALAAGVIRT